MRIKAPLSVVWLSTVVLATLALLAGCSRTVRTDTQVASDVQTRIYSDGAVQSRDISVQAASGVVTLEGTVTSDTERGAVANDAGAVDGVKTVINNLQVRQAQIAPPPPASLKKKPVRHQKSDDQSKNELQAQDAPPLMQEQPQAAPAPPQPPPPPPPPQKITVPAGTQLSVRLNDPLDSEKNQVGDTFRGALSTPIVLNGETVIPSGADVVGRVAAVQSAGRFAGQSLLTLELTSVSVNGKTYNVQTNQWTRSGKGEGKNTATKVGVGTVAGAVLGGLIGGGKGAAIGAASGAGAGTGVAAAKKGEQIKLGSEAVLNFQTINTLVVVPQANNNRNAGRAPLS